MATSNPAPQILHPVIGMGSQIPPIDEVEVVVSGVAAVVGRTVVVVLPTTVVVTVAGVVDALADLADTDLADLADVTQTIPATDMDPSTAAAPKSIASSLSARRPRWLERLAEVGLAAARRPVMATMLGRADFRCMMEVSSFGELMRERVNDVVRFDLVKRL